MTTIEELTNPALFLPSSSGCGAGKRTVPALEPSGSDIQRTRNRGRGRQRGRCCLWRSRPCRMTSLQPVASVVRTSRICLSARKRDSLASNSMMGQRQRCLISERSQPCLLFKAWGPVCPGHPRFLRRASASSRIVCDLARCWAAVSRRSWRGFSCRQSSEVSSMQLRTKPKRR